MALPTLIVVAGPPGAGKTTLAMRVGESIPAPILQKDAIKEGISLTDGARATQGGAIARRTFDSLYRCTDVLISNGCTVIVDAAFHRDYFELEIARFRDRAEARLLICAVPTEVAAQRYRVRAESGDVRRFAHPDGSVIEEMRVGSFPWDTYDLTGTDLPTLCVDTRNGYDPSMERVVAFLRSGSLASREA